MINCLAHIDSNPLRAGIVGSKEFVAENYQGKLQFNLIIYIFMGVTFFIPVRINDQTKFP